MLTELIHMLKIQCKLDLCAPYNDTFISFADEAAWLDVGRAVH